MNFTKNYRINTGKVFHRDGKQIILILSVRLSDKLKSIRSGAIYNKKEGESAMSIIMQKDEAHRIIDRMSPNATWDDLMREIYIREAVERGLADSKAGRTKDVKEIRVKYGLLE